MAGKLTCGIRALEEPARYGDGDGLWLQVRSPECRAMAGKLTCGIRALEEPARYGDGRAMATGSLARAQELVAWISARP
jgi:hypothetical protein